MTGTILGGHYILAGIIVSLAACAAAFVLLYQLGRQLLGEDGAYRAVLYLSLFPMALFLGAVYSESVYLTLSLASFLLALRGRFAFAAVAVGLAILTRSAGLALLPAIGLLAWRSDDRARSLASLLIAPAIAAVWPLWLWVRIGDPFVFLDAQQEAWGRELSPFGPLGGLGRGIEAAWAGIRQLIAGPGGEIFWPHATDTGPMNVAAQNLHQFGYPGAVRRAGSGGLAKVRRALRAARLREPRPTARRADRRLAAPLDAAVRPRHLPDLPRARLPRLTTTGTHRHDRDQRLPALPVGRAVGDIPMGLLS